MILFLRSSAVSHANSSTGVGIHFLQIIFCVSVIFLILLFIFACCLYVFQKIIVEMFSKETIRACLTVIFAKKFVLKMVTFLVSETLFWFNCCLNIQFRLTILRLITSSRFCTTFRVTLYFLTMGQFPMYYY